MRVKLGQCLAYHYLGSQWDLFFDDGWKNWTRVSVHSKDNQQQAILVEGRFRPRAQLQEIAKGLIKK